MKTIKPIIAAAAIICIFHVNSFSFSFKDEDNIKVAGKDGAFGGLNYGYATLADTNLYNTTAATDTKFYTGGVVLNGGYKLEYLKAEIMAGFVGTCGSSPLSFGV